MIILDYSKKYHKQIIATCAKALKQGKTVVYPTDTSYGLAGDIYNPKTLNKIYRIKERDFNKPIHVVIPNKDYGKKVSVWDGRAEKLAKKFWPGVLTLVLPLKLESLSAVDKKVYLKLGAKTKTVGLRIPKKDIALDLAKQLGRPITATGANPSFQLSGGYDAYTAEDVVKQFESKKYKPDIIISAGKLPKRKPSTLVKLTDEGYDILRKGPISEIQIKKVLGFRY